MSNFAGGSAAAMARQVADGSAQVTESGLRRLNGFELDAFALAVGDLQHEILGQPPEDGPVAIRERNLRVQRLNTCRLMVQTFRRRRRS